MSTRDQILTRLRLAARGATPPAPWQSRRNFPDLVARFKSAVEAAKGEVVLCRSDAEVKVALQAIIAQTSAERVIANDKPLLQHLALPNVDFRFAEARGDWNLRRFCERADIGVSAVAAAFAETGTVVLRGGGRLVTLLPPVHVAVVSAEQLLPDLITWVQNPATATDIAATANTVFVSGPSKTADVEQTLTLGAHGPKRFIVLLRMNSEST